MNTNHPDIVTNILDAFMEDNLKEIIADGVFDGLTPDQMTSAIFRSLRKFATPPADAAVITFDAALKEALAKAVANGVAEGRPAHLIADTLMDELRAGADGITAADAPPVGAGDRVRRWNVVVDYAPEVDGDNNDPACLSHEHHFHVEELEDIHQIIESGPAFDRIRGIEIRYALGAYAHQTLREFAARWPEGALGETPAHGGAIENILVRAGRLQALEFANRRVRGDHTPDIKTLIDEAGHVAAFLDGKTPETSGRPAVAAAAAVARAA